MSEQTSLANPTGKLEHVFQDIAENRMAGVPILNSALAVEAVGFRQFEGRWHGIVITPWFMNLLVLPGDEDDWAGQASGTKTDLEIPAGEVTFLHAMEDRLGPYLSHSLYSPMQDFHDQGYARSVAEEVLQLLYTPTIEAGVPETEAMPPGLHAKLEKPVNRRGFLSAFLPMEKSQ